MKDERKTKKQLIAELIEMRQRVAELEAAETERQQAEEESRTSEERYRNLVELAPDGIITVDVKGVIASINTAFTTLTGFSKDEIVGTHFTKLGTIRSQDLPQYLRMFNDTVRGKVPKSVEFTFHRKNGTTGWGEVHAALLKEKGKVVGIQAILRDTTERRQAEEALRESEERLRLVVQNMPVMIDAIDAGGNFVLWNRECERVTGYSADEIIGNPRAMELLYPDSERLERVIGEVAEHVSDFRDFEWDIKCKDGGVRTVSWANISNQVPIPGWMQWAIGIDITERKRAEEVLRESEARYRAVFETTGTATVIVEEDTMISLANAEFEKLSGYSREELEGKKSWTEFVVEDDLERMRTHHRLRRIDPDAAPRNYEFRFIDKWDNVRNIFLTITMIPGTEKSVASLLDITERKRAEEELKRHAVQLATLHDTSSAVASRLTPEEIFDAVVHSLSEAFGYRLVNIYLVEEGALELKAHVGLLDLAAAHIPLEEGVVGRTARTGQPQLITNVEEDPDFFHGAPGITSEACVPLKIGDEVLGVLNIENDEVGRPLDDSDLQLLTLLSNHIVVALENARLYEAAQRELAERVRVEEALRESEEKYRTILESIEDSYYEVDIAGNFVFFNDALCRMLGYPEDELMGMNNRQYMDDETAKAVYQTFNAVYRTGKPTRAFDWEIIRKDGTRRFVEASISLISGSTGEPAGFRGIVRDITERVRAEEALRRQALIFENLYDAIIVTDLEGYIADWNPAATRMYGYSKEEMLGKTAEILNEPEESAPLTTKIINGVMRDGRWSGEIRFIRNDGTGGVSETIVLPLYDEHDNQVALIGVNRDITERVWAEKALQEYSERLEEMVEERTQELREAQEQLVTLEILNQEVATSEKIISSLLDFARVRPPMRRKVDLNDVVRAALSRTAVPEDVEVVSQLDETLSVIQADPDQLVQVCGNIILNGVQAMLPLSSPPRAVGTKGGRLVIKTEVLSPERVAVSFTDTGVGIPEENLESIFEPLFTTKAKGIGLGLALVKTLVEANGGSIEVESEVGQGSTFTVRLPTDGPNKTVTV